MQKGGKYEGGQLQLISFVALFTLQIPPFLHMSDPTSHGTNCTGEGRAASIFVVTVVILVFVGTVVTLVFVGTVVILVSVGTVVTLVFVGTVVTLVPVGTVVTLVFVWTPGVVGAVIMGEPISHVDPPKPFTHKQYAISSPRTRQLPPFLQVVELQVLIFARPEPVVRTGLTVVVTTGSVAGTPLLVWQ